MEKINPIRFAFAGFRHAHIFSLFKSVHEHPRLELAAICEEHPEASLLAGQGLKADFTSVEEMLNRTDCDVVALGDCYGKRGATAIRALRTGKHVLADKPLCTSLEEFEEIQALSREKGLKVGMMLDMRDSKNMTALRDLVRSGRIGEVQTISLAGQHPLLRATRPSWYFEPGMHGGTLNDIAIHAMDFVPWLTGVEWGEVVAARSWNAKADTCPAFRDCAQFLAKLSNGGGVLGDVSYLSPEKCGYKIENYWRTTVHGTTGVAETAPSLSGVRVADDSSPAMELLSSEDARPCGYLEDFIADLDGEPAPGGLDTPAVLKASRNALLLQLAADTSSTQKLA